MTEITNNENYISENIKKYYNIMARYRNGEFGDKYLTLAEILSLAGESNLLDEMSPWDLQYLIDNTMGMLRLVFASHLKNKLNIEQEQYTLKRNK